ncbi:LPS O-antigen chain length determinant protein WzzB [Aeromonas sp. QDB11]|uniref:LPS O-antigen chain length determinant protein WzzB n=1 Tax=Aeromonas sp. QDB11 TaxID=2990482 RepID=UPI0022E6F282|nr:Wzz/FepE/Etk N-terminal domain-containing protein [Aeromonas sp. QDB11]
MLSKNDLPSAFSSEDDEIDLRDIISILWRDKLLILLLSFMFLSISSIYAFLARQVWTSQALISEPSIKQVEALELGVAQIKGSMPLNAAEQIDFSTLARPEIYKSFIVAFNSMSNKKAFLINEGVFAEEIKRANIKDGRSERALMDELSKAIVAIPFDKVSTDFTLRFSADSAELANQRLSKYIDFIQTQQIAEKNEELNSILNSRIKALSVQYENIKSDALKNLQDEIVRTQYSLQISEAAGVDRPLERIGSESIFNIDLGRKGLAEKLRILNGIKNPEVLTPELTKVRQQLNSLKALNLTNSKFSSFHIIDSPEEPFTRDKPKRPLIVVLGTLLGGMLGIVIVLVRHAFRRPEQV